MQFFNAVVFAVVGFAAAMPNAAPDAADNVLEKRVSSPTIRSILKRVVYVRL